MILWHNPRCSKSRASVALLHRHGIDVTLRRYLEDEPSLEELRAVQVKLGLAAIDMMRLKDPAFRDMGLHRDMAETELLTAMATTPKLIERPILITEHRAVIGRPPDNLLALL